MEIDTDAQSDLLIGMNLGSLAESELARTLISDLAGKVGATPDEQAGCWRAWETSRSGYLHSSEGSTRCAGWKLREFPESSEVGGLQSMRVSPDTVMLGSPDAFRWAMLGKSLGCRSGPTSRSAATEPDLSFLGLGQASGSGCIGTGSEQQVTHNQNQIWREPERRISHGHGHGYGRCHSRKTCSGVLGEDGPARYASVHGRASVHYALVLDRTATLRVSGHS